MPSGNGLSPEDTAMLEADLREMEWFADRPAHLGGLEARQAKLLLQLVTDRLSPPSPESIHDKVTAFLENFACIRAGVEGADVVTDAVSEVLG